MEQGISRRSLFKLGGIAAIGAAGAGALAGCGTTESVPAGQAAADATTAAGHNRSGLPSFFDKSAPIKDVAETKDYDIVVIGAGAPGVNGVWTIMGEVSPPPVGRTASEHGQRAPVRGRAGRAWGLRRPLRPFTLRHAPFSRTAEGEGA